MIKIKLYLCVLCLYIVHFTHTFSLESYSENYYAEVYIPKESRGMNECKICMFPRGIHSIDENLSNELNQMASVKTNWIMSLYTSTLFKDNIKGSRFETSSEISFSDFIYQFLGCGHDLKSVSFLIFLNRYDFTSRRASNIRRYLLDITRSIPKDFEVSNEQHQDSIVASISFFLSDYREGNFYQTDFPVPEVGDFTASITNKILSNYALGKGKTFYLTPSHPPYPSFHKSLFDWINDTKDFVHYGFTLEKKAALWYGYVSFPYWGGLEKMEPIFLLNIDNEFTANKDREIVNYLKRLDFEEKSSHLFETTNKLSLWSRFLLWSPQKIELHIVHKTSYSCSEINPLIIKDLSDRMFNDASSFKKVNILWRNTLQNVSPYSKFFGSIEFLMNPLRSVLKDTIIMDRNVSSFHSAKEVFDFIKPDFSSIYIGVFSIVSLGVLFSVISDTIGFSEGPIHHSANHTSIG